MPNNNAKQLFQRVMPKTVEKNNDRSTFNWRVQHALFQPDTRSRGIIAHHNAQRFTSIGNLQ